ncbi:MAG: Type I Iterative PKS [Sclerophora amabilis]|nr:MAG: Type I Iterative PKS [Sclerophora amabilis]
MSSLRLLGAGGRCYSYDSRAEGFGRGEGAACVVLKSLTEARASGDTTRAVLCNTAANQDGKTAGISMPNGSAQVQLLQQVYESADMNPWDTVYWEGHGTGTATGDPIEADSISQVIKGGKPCNSKMYLGSVKSNFGHLEGTSGLLSVIKCTMMLERGMILPNANFEHANPAVSLQECSMKIPTELIPWPSGPPRRASINNFGFGGSNAHAILEQAPQLTEKYTNGIMLSVQDVNKLPSDRNGNKGVTQPTEATSDQLPPCKTPSQHRRPAAQSGKIMAQLYVLSAKHKEGPEQLAELLSTYLDTRKEKQSHEFLADLAYTLCQRRSEFPWRYAAVANSPSQLVEQMRSKNHQGHATSPPRFGFVFTGQGAHWPQMASELMVYPAFAEQIEAAEKCLLEFGATWSIQEELRKEPEISCIGHASISQPVVTAIQVAMVQMLASWGVRPSVVTGHSSGEIAAAFAAGFLDLRSCMAVAYFRGAVAARISEGKGSRHGAMLVVGGHAGTAEGLLDSITEGEATVACLNSPQSTTFSGDRTAIEQLESLAKKASIFSRRLNVDVAYHSHHMNDVADEYRSAISRFATPSSDSRLTAAFYSSVAGCQLKADLVNTNYWVTNLTSPVHFASAVQAMCLGEDSKVAAHHSSIDTLVEIGPHSALSGPIKQILQADQKQKGNKQIKYLSVLERGRDGVQTALELAAEMFVLGTVLNFAAINVTIPERRSQVLSDLPSYPWNTVNKYWHDSRISRVIKHRSANWNVILGSPASDCLPEEVRFRNIFTLDDIPWLRHHQVDGQIVFPMAGYISMAVEAANHKAGTHSEKISGFQLRTVSISRALLLHETTKVDLNIVLRACDKGTNMSSDIWSQFQIASWTQESRWMEHCRGIICVKKEKEPNPIEGERTMTEAKTKNIEWTAEMESHCTKIQNVEGLYQKAADAGLRYGSTFQGMRELKAGSNSYVGNIRICDTAALMPEAFENRLIVHPTTLDSCLHPVLATFIDDEGAVTARVPTFIESLYISKSLPHSTGEKLRVYVDKFQESDPSKTATRSLGVFADTPLRGEPLIRMNGLTLKPTASELEPSSRESFGNFRVNYKPHLAFLRKQQLHQILEIDALQQKELDLIRDMDGASYHYLEQALLDSSTSRAKGSPTHLSNLYRWIDDTVRQVNAGQQLTGADSWRNLSPDDRQQKLTELSASGAAGRLICAIGQELPRILRQEIDPLSIMLKDNLLGEYYEQSPQTERGSIQMAHFVSLVGHQNPHLRILEIGAGTGGTTSAVLRALTPSTAEPPQFQKYDYTGITSGFFEMRASSLRSGPLDIEKDPTQQGFSNSTYDLIIAANVLHATAEMSRTLQYVRQLMKPGGRLALLEITQSRLANFPFATLPGWWLGKVCQNFSVSPEDKQCSMMPRCIPQDSHGTLFVCHGFCETFPVFSGSFYAFFMKILENDGPIVPEPKWEALLRQQGFSGLDMSEHDYPEDTDHTQSLLCSTAIGQDFAPKGVESITIVCDQAPSGVELSTLSGSLAAYTDKVSRCNLAQVTNEGSTYVCLDEMISSTMAQMTPERFHGIQRLLKSAKGILWVARDTVPNVTDPNLDFIHGFARTLRLENAALKFVTLRLSSTSESKEAVEAVIEQVFKQSFVDVPTDFNCDTEFVEIDGLVQIPRLSPDQIINDFVLGEVDHSRLETEDYWQDDRTLALAVGQTGFIDTVYYKDQDPPSAYSSIGDDEIEIEIRATGLNFRDVLIALGSLPDTDLGFECSGVVTSVGKNRDYRPGDRVCYAGHCFFGNRIRTASPIIERIPDSLSYEEAASIPVVFLTAHISLVETARLERGETVLIHAASGGTGQAAIAVAQLIGAEIFATVGSQQKKELLMKHFNIPAGHIFSSRDTSFAEAIMRITNGRGVDVVLNSLTGEYLRTSWSIMANFGRFIEIGKMDASANNYLEMQPFLRGVSYRAIDLRLMVLERPAYVGKMLSTVMGLIRPGTVKLVAPLNVFSPGEVGEALHMMQAGKHMGKIVVSAHKAARVKASPRRIDTNLLSAEATYLITGGSGGLGRSLASWFIQQGARNIILASRSGPSAPGAQELIGELEAKNARIRAYCCDVADKTQVKTLLKNCSQDMPPVRGVVHGALWLNDSLFDRSTFQDWQKTVATRVQGAWNLHDALQSQSLDFFVCLSSVAGIAGNVGQASYAGTGTFFEAFCRFRTFQNLPVTTIHLPVVTDVGYVAERSTTQEQLKQLYGETINEAEFHMLVKAAITGRIGEPSNYQSIVGLSIKPEMLDKPYLQDPRFAYLRRIAMGAKPSVELSPVVPTAVRDALKGASTHDKAYKLVYDGTAAKFSRIMMIPIEDITPDKSITAYGLDSLVAVDFRNWMIKETEAEISMMELLDGISLHQLVITILATSSIVQDNARPVAASERQ